jgi:Flp pilus assembly protein TadD
MRARVQSLLLLVALGVFATGATAQVNPNAPQDVIGQVYGPGGQLTQSIQVEFWPDDAHRPPDRVFTDSNGRFYLSQLRPHTSYTLKVETDGRNWATTTTTLRITGRFTTVRIHLQPFRSTVPAHGGAVSAADLRQPGVPRPARKEFEAAMEIIKKKGYEEAQPHLERAIELFPDFVEARNELAVAKLKAGDLTAAETLLRRAIEIDPAAPRPLFNLGLCIHRQARYADAVSLIERAIQLDPGNYRGHLLLGINWVMASNDARAEAALLKAYDLGGQAAAKAQYHLARFYTARRRYERAAKALQIYLRDVPNDPDAIELQETITKLRTARR